MTERTSSSGISRVLIVCTNFPPSNSTGARRPYYLARTLVEQGFEVAVLTSALELPDPWLAEMDGIAVERLPTTPLPDGLNNAQRRLAFLYWRLMGHPLHVISRALAFLFLPLDFSSRMDFDEIRVAKKIGRCDLVVSTGPGWSTFEFGHRLSDQWKCPFMIDYRDPWNVRLPEVGLHTVTWHGGGIIGWLKRSRMKRAERKYTVGVIGITAATKTVLLNTLQCVGDYPAMVIHNGFDAGRAKDKYEPMSKMTLLYTGRLYHEQEWDIVLDAFENIHAKYPERAEKMELLLVGPVSDDRDLMKRLNQCADRTGMVRMLARAGRDETLQLQQSVDLLLHVGFKDKKGILPVKFIEYLNAGRPILQVSTGYDDQERILESTETGTIHSTSGSLAEKILKSLDLRVSGGVIPHKPNEIALAEYTWKNQMERWIRFIEESYKEATQGR